MSKCKECEGEKKPLKGGCNTPKVLQIESKEAPVLFHRIDVPTAMGDDESNPPVQGQYKNILLVYEANSHAYMFNSDGVYTQISWGDSNNFDALINRPSYAGVLMTHATNIPDVDAAVLEETVARMASDTALGTALNTETAERQANVADLSDRIDDEETAREQAVTAVSNDLEQEIADRAAADTALGARIDTEAQTRATADTALGARIDNIESRGRYLSSWDATTGLPGTEPESLPYAYKTGDYFIVSTVGTTNYKPSGSSYTGAASTTVETGVISLNDTYLYDGTTWELIHTDIPEIAIDDELSTTSRNPVENRTITNALGGKVDKVTGKQLSTEDYTTAEKTKLAGLVNTVLESTTGQSTTAGMTQKAITDALASAGGGIKLLTTADYNWPTTGTKTDIALWLLEPGIYMFDQGVNGHIKSDSYSTLGMSISDTVAIANSNNDVYLTKFEAWNNLLASGNYVTYWKVDKTTGSQDSRIKNLKVVNDLNTEENYQALSAKQGKVLKDMIDALPEAPNVVQFTGTSTTDVMSQKATTDMIYDDGNNKTRIVLGASASAFGADGIALGRNASAFTGQGVLAFGRNSVAGANNAHGSIALGAYSSATTQGEMNIGTSDTFYGYNSTNYRLLTGVHDPVSDHDAATKGYVDTTVSNVETWTFTLADDTTVTKNVVLEAE